MKTAALSFFAASAILTALLAACFNPITAVPPQGGDSVTDPSDAIPGEAGGAGIPDTGAFTVTIAVNPVSGGDAGRAAWLESTVIQTGGVRNTFLLVALDNKENKKEVAGFWEDDKETDGSEVTTVKVSLPSGTYNFLLLLGHRERSYAAETGGKCVYKAGAPTLLAAGLKEATIDTEGTTEVTITMKPVTVAAKFTSTAPGKSVEADTKGVELERADDWKLTWEVGAGGLGELKAALAARSGGPYPLFRNVTAWRTDGTVAGFSSDASFDYSTDGPGTITLNLEEAPKGVPCAAWFNLEYAPFSLAAEQWAAPVWVIRNGVNDLPQNDKTDFSPDTTNNNKIKWDGTINGNGAVRFTLPLPLVANLDLAGKVPQPAGGVVPTQAVADTQYMGTVRWENPDGTPFGLFAAEADGTPHPYTARVTLYALSGYTFDGLAENSFSYTPNGGVTNLAGPVVVTNPAGTGDTLEVCVKFWVKVNDLDLTNYISRTLTWTNGSVQYTRTNKSYTLKFDEDYFATVTLTANPGYIFGEIPATPDAGGKPVSGGFTHSGASSVSHAAGVADTDLDVTVAFPFITANATGGEPKPIKVGDKFYEVHTFTDTTRSHEFKFNSDTTLPVNVAVLVVGGGGGGGYSSQGGKSANGNDYQRGGGGGAGRYMDVPAYPVTDLTPISVTVGAGGTGGTTGSGTDSELEQARFGKNGGNSVFGGITAPGGGGGAYHYPDHATDGQPGGSSGGGSNGKSGGALILGTVTGDVIATVNAGNNGGAASGLHTGAGGGGAGAVGSDSTDGRYSVLGGKGLSSEISGELKWYAGGGAGGALVNSSWTDANYPDYSKGAYGAVGAKPGIGGADGEANTGDGGAGGGANSTITFNGGNGGSGIVIVRWPYIWKEQNE